MHSLVKEGGLVNVMEDMKHMSEVFYYSNVPKDAHRAEISIQISALAGVWTLDLSLGSPAGNH